MAVFTPVSDDICREFLKQYNIGELASLEGIMQGVENSNFHLKTTSGRYVLTLFEKRVSQDDLPFFLDVMRGMAANGIPCPEPIIANDGKILRECAGRPAIIISFLSGGDLKPAQITSAHCKSLGRMLARMHKVGAKLPLPLGEGGGEGRQRVIAQQTPHPTLSQGERALSRASLHRPNNLGLPGWQSLADRIGNRMDEIKSGLAVATAQLLHELKSGWPHNLQSGIVHADLFPDNVFFDDSANVSGVIDFYFSCTDSFIYDYAIVQNAWCFDSYPSQLNSCEGYMKIEAESPIFPAVGSETKSWQANSSNNKGVLHKMNEERRLALFDGYMSEGGMIKEDEWALLPIVAKGAALRFFLTRAHDLIFGDPEAFVKPKDPLEYWQKLEFYQ